MKAALLFSLLCCTASGLRAVCATTSAPPLLEVEMCWADYYALAYGVPLEFVQAIIDVESAWRPYVISAKGAAVLMQLTPPAAFRFGVTNRFLIEENIRGGVVYLAYFIRRFEGEPRLVAAAWGVFGFMYKRSQGTVAATHRAMLNNRLKIAAFYAVVAGSDLLLIRFALRDMSIPAGKTEGTSAARHESGP
jgi:soluble lytic murein transglycosylase-like protein